MPGLLDGLIFCQEHGCPMIHIRGSYVCLFKYVDAHLGGQMVRDLVPGAQDAPAMLVFGDGHSLPLICAHCGKALHLDEPDAALEVIAGQYLVALEYDEEANALVLLFSPDPDKGEGEPIAVHLDSARKLVCPDQQRRRKARSRRR
jgi:hypothetical protein